jgi:hypothetical protein
VPVSVNQSQIEKKKEVRAERFGLNAEEKRRLDRAKRFNLETSEVVRSSLSFIEPQTPTLTTLLLSVALQFEEKRRKRAERFAAAPK